MIIFRSDGVSDTDILLSLMGDKLNEMLFRERGAFHGQKSGVRWYSGSRDR
jgi:hypothetical protein